MYYYPYSPVGAVVQRLERATDNQVLAGSNPAGAVRKLAISFTLCQCFFSEDTLKAVGPFLSFAIINRSEVKHLTRGVTVSPVVDSVILPGQYCLLDNVKVKVKSYSYGELNCGGLHILITFI